MEYVLLVGVLFVVVIVPLWKTASKLRNELEVAQEQAEALGKDVTRLADELDEAQGEKEQLTREKGRLASELEQKQKEVFSLSKYRVIRDAEARSEEILTTAKDESKKMRERAKAQLDASVQEAQRIEAAAKAEAERIAGDAFEAKGKADMYEKTVRAMRNIINGYGDEYLVPNRSILDSLAEEFDHQQAGQELKAARKHTREMIKQGLAANCEYVEKNKKETAIRFVLDAFNGKVDTTLAKVKHDNLGKLKQEILDAFSLVNRTGEAFRKARIEPAYLEARLDELRWAVTTNELKLEAREEQRRIKEAMREEEKARREYEKARKQAEKEEKDIVAKMKKAQKALEEANEEQRVAFEQQLQELQEKLAEAEAKNERALSMAQQTRRGHVYVISNVGSFGEEVFKIGMTRRLEPFDRVRELGDASVPFPFDVHAMLFSEDAPALENALHHEFEAQQVNLVNNRKEFFNVGITRIRELVEEMGIEAHWTMEAEAAQYRESQTLRKAVQKAEGAVSAA